MAKDEEIKRLRQQVRDLQEELDDVKDESWQQQDEIEGLREALQLREFEEQEDLVWRGRYAELVEACGIELTSVDLELCHERTIWLVRGGDRVRRTA